MEYQQVAPQLQIRVGAADARDWRTQLETAISNLHKAFPQMLAPTAALDSRKPLEDIGRVHTWHDIKMVLHQLSSEVHEQLAKIQSREKFLNNEFAARTDEYRNKKGNFDLLQVRANLTDA